MTPEQIAAAIEDAFYEGFGAYETACVPHRDVDFMWAHSEAKATADRILKEAQAQPSGNAGEVERDAERLDWLQEQAKLSRSGIGFDWRPAYAEDGIVVEPKGWRFMRHAQLGERKPSIREAIDAAIAASKGANHG